MNVQLGKKLIVPLVEAAVILLLIFLCPDFLDEEKVKCYYTLCVQLVFFCIIHTLCIFTREIDIISPLLLLTVIHLLMFEITPILCLLNNDILWFELDLWGGAVKGTWISTLGYLCVFLAYHLKKGRLVFRQNKVPVHQPLELPKESEQNVFIANLIFWSVAFVSNVVLILSTGKSLSYIFSLGLNENTGTISGYNALGFLGVIAYAMLPSYLYIFTLAKSRALKIILFYLMFATFMLRGFRFIMVAVIISPIILQNLRKSKRPKGYQIAIVFLLLLVMIGFVGAVRKDVRAGRGLTETALKMINFDFLFETIADNFSIVKTYYGIVQHIPSDMGYTFGNQIFLYTLVMMIPRMIWRGKPIPVVKKVIAKSVSPYSAIAGTAYPYIGEYYHEFGIIGVAALCSLLGWLCQKLNTYKQQNDIHSAVSFATLYPLLFQVLIRGYTPSNFYMILFVIVPIVLSKKIAEGRFKWMEKK